MPMVYNAAIIAVVCISIFILRFRQSNDTNDIKHNKKLCKIEHASFQISDLFRAIVINIKTKFCDVPPLS